MWLRCKVGPYDGQILDYSIPAAKNLLQSGLAEELTEEELTAFFAGSGDEKAVLPEPETPEKPVWGLKMSPDEYLERYPEGKNAELARKITEE